MSKKDLPNLKDVSRIPEELIPVVQWWQEKGPKTLSTVGIVILIVAAIFFWVESAKEKQNDAITAYAVMDAQGETAAREEATSIIIDADVTMAPIAQLDRAHHRYTAGDYEAALADYETLVATLEEPALKDIAILGRIHALEAVKEYDQALSALAEVEAQFTQATPKHYLSAQTLCTKARLLCQKGDKAGAKVTLEGLLTSTDPAEKAMAEKTLKMIDAYDPATLEMPVVPVTPVPEVTPAPEATPEATPAPEATPEA